MRNKLGFYKDIRQIALNTIIKYFQPIHTYISEDLGVYGKNGKGPGHLSGQGNAEAHGETAATRERREVVLPITGGSNEGGRDRLYPDLNPLEA